MGGSAGLMPSKSSLRFSSDAISPFNSAMLCAVSAGLLARSLWALYVWYSGDLSPKMRLTLSRMCNSARARTASR